MNATTGVATVLVVGIVLWLCIFAMRMSYEKYCIRIGKPFRSWLGEGQ